MEVLLNNRVIIQLQFDSVPPAHLLFLSYSLSECLCILCAVLAIYTSKCSAQSGGGFLLLQLLFVSRKFNVIVKYFPRRDALIFSITSETSASALLFFCFSC